MKRETNYFELYKPQPFNIGNRLFTDVREPFPQRLEPTTQNKIANLKDEMRMLIETFKQKEICDNEFACRYDLIICELEDLGTPRHELKPSTKRKFEHDRTDMEVDMNAEE
jgi:hypothetical protein